MAKRNRQNPPSTDTPTAIRRMAIVAIVSDTELVQRLVLKGGNALELAHRISTRASLDLDFSMEGAFRPESLLGLRDRIEANLVRVFTPAGLTVLDVRLEERPEKVSARLEAFWGGYRLEFKLIETEKVAELARTPNRLRKSAMPVGYRGSTRLEIDISKHEYCAEKDEITIDGHAVFVYTPQMIACEKLRALSQQTPEYISFVGGHSAARARDFLDIHDVLERFTIILTTPRNGLLLRRIFAAKRVPLRLLGSIRAQREFHRQDWPAVVDTVRAGIDLREFDFYFDFVLREIEKLEPFGDD